MGQIALSLPQTGLPNSTEDVKVTNDLTLIQNVINGNLDSSNIAASLGQAAGVNVSGQTVKGATSIAASESRSNVAYGTLTTPDQVAGIVLPVNGLIAVWYQATWQESVGAAARAAIFLNGNQLQVVNGLGTTPASATQAACTLSSSTGVNNSLTTCPVGLVGSHSGTSYTGDVTTGQAVGVFFPNPSNLPAMEIGGATQQVGNTGSGSVQGGPCCIFAAAGTYTVSVQFKASSGSVTASNRKLWVQALSFA